MKKEPARFSRYDILPNAVTDAPLIPGCLVLEGGGWRGLYTQGVLDAMMEADINMQTVIGVSAGSMSSLAYASGQIGMSARVNLKYRMDPRYCGIGSIKEEHGMTGFRYFFKEIVPACGYAWDRIPYEWAIKEGYKKIIVVRTRDKGYRKEKKSGRLANALLYGSRPAFRKALDESAEKYNACLNRLDQDEAAGKIFVQAPEHPVHVGRFEKDLEKLGLLYETGYREMKERIPELKAYLA